MRATGRQVRARGEAAEARRALTHVCDALGVDVPETDRRALSSLAVPELRALRTAVLRTWGWPGVGPPRG